MINNVFKVYIIFLVAVSSISQTHYEVEYALEPVNLEKIQKLSIGENEKETLIGYLSIINKSLNKTKDTPFYTLEFDEEKSIFSKIPRMGSDHDRFLNDYIAEHLVYADFSKKTIEIFNAYPEKYFLVEVDYIENWKIHNETKKIIDFNCVKATARIINPSTGKLIEVEAWFAKDLPFSFGPHYANGLPGLILQFKYGQALDLKAVSMKKKSKDLKTKKPKYIKKMSPKEYNNYVKGNLKFE